MSKEFLEDVLSGKIKYNDVEDYEEEMDNIEKDLNDLIKSKKSTKIDKLKYYIKKINYLVYGKDKEMIKQNFLKIKKEKDMSIYLLLYLKYILIIVQKN